VQLTLSTHLMVHGRMDAAALAAVRQSGYGTVEVWLAEPHVPWREPGPCEAFGARLAEHGLRAGSVHLPFYPSVPQLLEQGRKWSLIDPDAAARREALAGAADGLHAAASLGASCAVLHLGWQRDAWDAHAHGHARAAVAELLPIARAAGVRLLLENIISAGTRAAALRALLDELDPAGEAGICLDLGHAHVDGGVMKELADAGPRLAHLHVHDNDGSEDAHLAPGRGSIPWRAVRTALAAVGYDGMGALELRDATRGARPAAALCAEAAAELRGFRADWEARSAAPA
jgi:sugar phosphate isomerase/epimerase